MGVGLELPLGLGDERRVSPGDTGKPKKAEAERRDECKTVVTQKRRGEQRRGEEGAGERRAELR